MKTPFKRKGCGPQKLGSPVKFVELLAKKLIVDKIAKKASPSKQVKSPIKKLSPACKAAAKKKFDVWPSAYASGWGVRCTKAGGPGKMGKSKK